MADSDNFDFSSPAYNTRSQSAKKKIQEKIQKEIQEKIVLENKIINIDFKQIFYDNDTTDETMIDFIDIYFCEYYFKNNQI